MNFVQICRGWYEFAQNTGKLVWFKKRKYLVSVFSENRAPKKHDFFRKASTIFSCAPFSKKQRISRI